MFFRCLDSVPTARRQTVLRAAACSWWAWATVGAVHAQCSVLSDPLAGGSTCTASPAATSPSVPALQPQARAVGTAPATSSHWEAAKTLPGQGQQVCAFFDQHTQRCLTERPNTAAYDRAMDVGINAAMMGMQVQADVLHRAKQQGLMGGSAPTGAAAGAQYLPAHVMSALPTDMQAGLRAITGAAPVQLPAQSAPMQVQSVLGAAAGLGDVAPTDCLQGHLDGIEQQQRRAPTTAEMRAAIEACER